MPLEVVAGRYELTRSLARGGMGEVFAALDRSTDRHVALKRLLPEVHGERGHIVHFMREYHALCELKHPRIIEVYEYGLDRDTPYYTMELLDGQDLRDLSPLSYTEACLYLRDVASSLALLHARRLLHRDVSPRNVRRTSGGHCKLIDFGVMIAFGVPPNVTGTVPCIPPEALQGSSLDQRSDLYALGALAYFMLTGRHGYPASTLNELPATWANPLQPVKRSAPVPDRLDDLVLSLMSLDPMRRPKSAAEVIDWLSAIAQLPPDDVPSVARSFFTSTQLCGRAQATGELTRLVKRAATGHGHALLVEGAVGTGKSRLLAEGIVIAQTCGLSAVHAVAQQQRGSSHLLARELVAAVQRVLPLEAEAAGASQIAWPRVLATHTTAEAASARAHDPSEERAQLQRSLTDVFSALARVRPLLISVDDLERADEFSISLLAGLAQQAVTLPLLVVVTRTTDPTRPRPKSDVLRSFEARTTLRELSAPQHAQLVLSMFGNVPSLDLLNDWLFRLDRGNPKLTVELAEHLFRRGLVRYVDGMWSVPQELITLQVPADLTAAWALRLQGLSVAATELAELLTVCRGRISVELCLAAGGGAPEVLFQGLDELVRAGILDSAGKDYVFAHDALRKALEQRLSPENRRAFHDRWANALLALGSQTPEVLLEAGWHLIHTADELRGADLLAEVAPVFVDEGMALTTAIPALEKALEVYERSGCRSLGAQLRLRSTLVLAGYTFDYRLAFRYGEQTVALLYEVAGLGIAARLGRYLGVHCALLVGLALAMLRRAWLPAVRRGPPVLIAMMYFSRSLLGLMGVRATSLDAPGAWSLFQKARPLAGAPWFTSGRIVYLSARAFAFQMLGREADMQDAAQVALHRLRTKRRRDLSVIDARSLLVGLLTTDGINESFREASQALERADRLDAIGTRLAQSGALRIRMHYYARRGDNERAEHYRKLLDLYATQGGTVWQGEWFSVPLEGLAGAAWLDLVAQRRSLAHLERLVEEVPALAGMRDAVQIGYHYRRGEYARTSELGELYIAAHPARTLVGWGVVYAATAFSWIELGQVERALALCEQAMAQLSPADRAYFTMYSSLECAHATAYAVRGELPRARELLRSCAERLRTHGEYAGLVLIHQAQARVARLVGDDAYLAEALAAIRDAALTSGLPAVILLADRVAQQRNKQRSSPPPPPLAAANDYTPIVADDTPPTDRTLITAFLERTAAADSRSHAAMWFLARYVQSEAAYLYRLDPQHASVQLMASYPNSDDPPELRSVVHESNPSDEVTAVRVKGTDDEEPRSFRLYFVGAAGPKPPWIGVVALQEGSDTTARVPDSQLVDIGRVLASELAEQIEPRAS